MIDKIKAFFAIMLIVIVIFAIGYSIVKTVMAALEQPNLITVSNLAEYTSDEKIVTSYSIYYYYEECVNNFFEACNRELYEELYNIYIKDYAKAQSKEEIISMLKDVKQKITPKDMDENIKCGLKKMYSTEDGYVAEIYVNEDLSYIIFNEANSKELSYSFAFVK